MKHLGFLVLAVMGSALMGCADSNGGKPAGDGFEDLKPLEKPADAASLEEIKKIFATIKHAQKILPAADALLDVSVANDTLHNVTAEEKEKALAELNEDGRALVKEMLRSCKIDNGKQKEQGKIAEGESLVTSSSHEISGARCPYTMKEVSSSKKTYLKLKDANENFESEALEESESKSIKDVRSFEIQKLSGIKSSKEAIKSSSKMTSQGTGDQKTYSILSNTNGNIEFVLTNRDVVWGTIKMNFSITDGSSKSQSLFELKSKVGAIRIVLIVKEDKSRELYINGEKVNPEEFGFGLAE